MERARRASAAAAHAAWEALRGRAPAVPDDPLGADDVRRTGRSSGGSGLVDGASFLKARSGRHAVHRDAE